MLFSEVLNSDFDNVVVINLWVLVLYNLEFLIFFIVDDKGDFIYVYLFSLLDKVR